MRSIDVNTGAEVYFDSKDIRWAEYIFVRNQPTRPSVMAKKEQTNTRNLITLQDSMKTKMNQFNRYLTTISQLVVLALLFNLLPLTAYALTDAQNLENKVYDSFEEDNVERTIDLIKQYLLKYPDEAPLSAEHMKLQLGGLYYIAGNKIKATQHLNQVIKKNRSFSWTKRAKFYLELVNTDTPPPTSHQALEALKLPVKFMSKHLALSDATDELLDDYYEYEKQKGYSGSKQQWKREARAGAHDPRNKMHNKWLEKMYDDAYKRMKKRGYQGSKEDFMLHINQKEKLRAEKRRAITTKDPIKIYETHIDENSPKQKLIRQIAANVPNTEVNLFRLKLADIYYNEMESESAIPLYVTAINHYLSYKHNANHNIAVGLLNLARSYIDTNQLEKAKQTFDRFYQSVAIRDDTQTQYKNAKLIIDANYALSDMALKDNNYKQVINLQLKSLQLAKTELSLQETSDILNKVESLFAQLRVKLKAKDGKTAAALSKDIIKLTNSALRIAPIELGRIYSYLFAASKRANDTTAMNQYKALATDALDSHISKINQIQDLVGDHQHVLDYIKYFHLDARNLLNLTHTYERLELDYANEIVIFINERNEMNVREYVQAGMTWERLLRNWLGYQNMHNQRYHKRLALSMKKQNAYYRNGDKYENAYSHYTQQYGEDTTEATHLALGIATDFGYRAISELKSRDDAFKKLKYSRKALLPVHQKHNPSSYDKIVNEGENTWAKYQMALCYSYLDEDGLAIFWAKDVINSLQKDKKKYAPKNNRFLDDYLKRKDEIYREVYEDIATLLIKHNRLVEAQQVIQMTKQYEHYQTLRANADNPITSTVEYTAFEKKAFSALYKLKTKIESLVHERDRLSKEVRQRGQNSSAKQKRLNLIVNQYIPQNTKEMLAYLKQLEIDFKNNPGTTAQNSHSLITEHSQLRKNIDALAKTEPQSKAVGLQYLVTENILNIILTLPNQQPKAYQIQYDRKKLYKDISTVSLQMQSPNAEAKYYASALQSLYQLLIEPVIADLNSAGAKTLMLSLDSKLRLLPFSALMDENGSYLLQDYTIAIYNEAANQALEQDSQPNWKIAAMGLSKPVGKLPALSTVPEELNGIINLASIKGDTYLNDQFSYQSFNKVLNANASYNVLHIASHFELSPGAPEQSYLYLGDGSQLSLAEIANKQFDFNHFDLVTYSACQTAAAGGKTADGSQMESLSAQTQRQGAQAVMATLWKVSDKSTTELMKNYYQQRSQQLNKAEALRATQLKMAIGKQTQWQSPHHWAGFVVSGNWR